MRSKANLSECDKLARTTQRTRNGESELQKASDDNGHSGLNAVL
jgi:hypothetical protein